MAIARSKVTAQGQISVPADVRRRLGIGPGSLLEWDAEGDRGFIRRAGKYTTEDIRKRLFAGNTPPHKTVEQMDEGIGKYMRSRYARD